MQITCEEQTLPTFDPSEEQALATINHAREEIRFFKGQQWQVTNYALIAYAALAAVPSWVEPDSWLYGWRSWVSWGTLGLVGVTMVWTLWMLWGLETARKMELRRLSEAREHLPFIDEIARRVAFIANQGQDRPENPREMLLEMLRRLRLWKPEVKPVLFAAVVLGWIVASLIILSRIPWVQ
jgi:hypothetical protein